MALEFRNVLKGQLTQSLVKTLFERAGYRVTRLGVEEIFAEIQHLDAAQYHSLSLPENLRFLPDFLVAEPELQKVFLLEVKFRRTFDATSAHSLYETLATQRQYWGESFAILTIAEPSSPDCRFHQDYIRILTPDLTEILNQSYLSAPFEPDAYKAPHYNYKYTFQTFGWSRLWDTLPTLNQVFARFIAVGDTAMNQAHADFATATLRSLSQL